ncbi:MAG: class I SAM-dependent methyltransferase [Anaeroplasmataceae bacterium]|nr:class I SAM-dependent methyltransferase [Anaeroplasmataceae bacterium]
MNRIQRIASFCKGSKVVCDIGCDHAYTLVYAIKNFGVEKGIAADIAQGPLLNAKKTIKEYHLEEQIKTILSDGFDAISNDEFDTAILSGMGGILICDILKRALPKLKEKRLIIEANNDTYRIREFLCSNGFYISKEDALYDHNKYYEILVFAKGHKDYSTLDFLYGPFLRREQPEAFLKYYHKKKKLLTSILPHIKSEEEKKDKLKLIAEIQIILKE